mmetsp:Transcript_2310/g.4827  ORF Transcript_2310/g.4827 Transcript_2310/m.4827 type:complete len:93 (+) Transcript_2310:488-766(+)
MPSSKCISSIGSCRQRHSDCDPTLFRWRKNLLDCITALRGCANLTKRLAPLDIAALNTCWQRRAIEWPNFRTSSDVCCCGAPYNFELVQRLF